MREIIYNGLKYSEMSEETKENLIENAFIAAPEWGPFIVEDAQINDIVVDNGGSSEMGESPSSGQTLVVQGIKMFLSGAKSNYQDIIDHMYTTWEFQDSAICTADAGGSLPNTSDYSFLFHKNFLKMTETIYNYNSSLLCYGLKMQYKNNEGDNWSSPEWFGYDWTNLGIATSFQWHIGVRASSSSYASTKCPEAKIGSGSTPVNYGTFFVIERISAEDTYTAKRGGTDTDSSYDCSCPYGYVIVQPYFMVVLKNNSGYLQPSYYANINDGSAASGSNGSNGYGYNWAAMFLNGTTVHPSKIKIFIPFRNEQERNYAFGITKTFTRLTREDYETRASAAASEAAGHPVEIHLPTVDDINEKYENENGGE